MAILPQRKLFGWKEIENIGDLARLKLVLEHLPDERLMRRMEEIRANGRDDYPVRAVWNSILAGVVYQHESIESLRRELKRNPHLCWLCGFELTRGEVVPPAWVYTRFLKKLMSMQDEIDRMFDEMVEELRGVLPGFGKTLAMDGKAIRTVARWRKGNEEKGEDGRRDTDADMGVKERRGKRKDGSLWKKVTKWFGYKLHLIVDATYELPVGYEITKASRSEIPEGRELVKKLKEKHPEIVEGSEYLTGDKGLDDTKLITLLWDDWGIKPVIDIRNMWKDGEETRLLDGQTNVVYDYRGTVYCYCPASGDRRAMAYGGFEAKRNTLKYRCPARHYGIKCKGLKGCRVGGSIRIHLNEERRVFTPLARSSYKWKTIYKKRTAVERVNSRLDVSFGFEHHYIRGLSKMKLRMGLALVTMLAMALGRIKEKQKEKMRSLVQAA